MPLLRSLESDLIRGVTAMRPESSLDSTTGKDDETNALKCASNEQKAGLGLVQSRGGSGGGGDSVIDVDRNGGGVDGAVKEDKMCRVCHLSSDCFSQSSDLIQLGCRCRNDLGAAHRNCAELWFATKGDRFCEICGEVATNISGVVDNGLRLEWNDAPRIRYSNMPVERRGLLKLKLYKATRDIPQVVHQRLHGWELENKRPSTRHKLATQGENRIRKSPLRLKASVRKAVLNPLKG